MAGLSLKLELGGKEEALADLDQLADRLTNTEPLMRGISGYLVNSTRQRFEDQVGPDGKPWKPSIRAQVLGEKTLLNKGLLRDSFNDAHGLDWAQVGSADFRASVFQFGATIRPRHRKALRFQLAGALGWRSLKEVTIAARPMLGASEEDREEILALAKSHLTVAP